MQLVFKFSIPSLSVIIFFHILIDSGIFFCKVLGDEWVWKPLLGIFVFFSWASLLSCSQALFFPLTLHYKGKERYPSQIKWLLYIENSHRFIVPCSSFRKKNF